MSGSALYHGVVVHTRLRPFRRRFQYRVFSLLLDLDDLPALDAAIPGFSHNRFDLLGFHDRDHGPGDGSPLRPWIDARLAEAGIDLQGGAVKLLCFPRMLGYVFDPLSVWFCYHRDGRLRAILHEVKNTFGEQHGYLVEVDLPGPDALLRYSFDKEFFVSPLMDMDATYAFRTRPPGERIAIHIDQRDDDGPLFAASLRGERTALSRTSAIRAFLRYPLMTLKVIAAIHWQALAHWRRGARYHRRPPPPAVSVRYVDSRSRVA